MHVDLVQIRSTPHYEPLVKRQTKQDKNHTTPRKYDFISVGSKVAVQ